MYGLGLKSKLPISDFRWMSEEECNRLLTSFQSYDVDGDHGAWLCVDMDYPDSLHDDHNEFPLAPESRKVGWNELSRRQQELFAMQWSKSVHDPRVCSKFEALSSSERNQLLASFQSRNLSKGRASHLGANASNLDRASQNDVTEDDCSRDYVPKPSEDLPVKWNQLSRRQQILIALHYSYSPDDPTIRSKFEAQPAKLLATLCNKRSYCVHIKVRFSQFTCMRQLTNFSVLHAEKYLCKSHAIKFFDDV